MRQTFREITNAFAAVGVLLAIRSDGRERLLESKLGRVEAHLLGLRATNLEIRTDERKHVGLGRVKGQGRADEARRQRCGGRTAHTAQKPPPRQSVLPFCT